VVVKGEERKSPFSVQLLASSQFFGKKNERSASTMFMFGKRTLAIRSVSD
jgi:hypothetical protein